MYPVCYHRIFSHAYSPHTEGLATLAATRGRVRQSSERVPRPRAACPGRSAPTFVLQHSTQHRRGKYEEGDSRQPPIPGYRLGITGRGSDCPEHRPGCWLHRARRVREARSSRNRDQQDAVWTSQESQRSRAESPQTQITAPHLCVCASSLSACALVFALPCLKFIPCLTMT